MTTIPEVHLAAEAIVAHVDGELAPVPRDRANAHLAKCPECRAAVAEQRRAKATLTVAAGPNPSSDLLARLRDIPMTTDLAAPGIVLAVENDEVVWGTAASVAPRGRAKRRARKERARPTGPDRPRTHSVHRMHLLSRGFAGVAAAAVVGVLAVSATTASSSGNDGPGRLTPPVQGTGTTSGTSVPGNAQTVENTTSLFVPRPAQAMPVFARAAHANR